MITPPETLYAKTAEGAYIAYQVIGDGPVDLIVVGGPASHLDIEWEEPSVVRSLQRFASFSRLVRFDRRGTGLSDPLQHEPSLEQQMDDLEAVMDAAKVGRAALMGAVEPMCAMYAATHPDRVRALVLLNVAAAGGEILGDELRQQLLDIIENHWGEGRMLGLFAPSRVGDKSFEEWWTRYERASASAQMSRKIIDFTMRTDLREILPTVRVPTLVLYGKGNPIVPIELTREVASLIPGARFAEYPGADTFGWADPESEAADEIEEFLTGQRRPREIERVLATVLFTDIVGSTMQASTLGDRSWRELLDRYDDIVARELNVFRGRHIKTTGDGTLATFDGPARAVRCARAITDAVGAIGITIRSGVHTGEIEMRGESDVAGIAVHIAQRVQEQAGEKEVLVSRTVVDLVVGSGLEFEDRGEQSLKGVPRAWRLFALTG